MIFVNDEPLDQLIDEADPNCVYIGFAAIGSATSAKKWKIKRIKKVGDVTFIGWANSTSGEINIWDDRAAVGTTYSQGG